MKFSALNKLFIGSLFNIFVVSEVTISLCSYARIQERNFFRYT